MEAINKLFSLTAQYPLLYGVEAKSEKELKQLQNILEELFKFNGWDSEKDPNTMADFRAAYRDFEVMWVMLEDFKDSMKSDYIQKVASNLEVAAKAAFNRIMEVMKKHQKLNAYFKENFTMKPADFKKEINHFVYHINN